MFNKTFELQIFQFLVRAYSNFKYLWDSNVKHCTHSLKNSLREKSPNTEFFLVRIFLYSDYGVISVFSPNAGKYGPKKLRIWILFTQ